MRQVSPDNCPAAGRNARAPEPVTTGSHRAEHSAHALVYSIITAFGAAAKDQPAVERLTADIREAIGAEGPAAAREEAMALGWLSVTACALDRAPDSLTPGD